MYRVLVSFLTIFFLLRCTGKDKSFDLETCCGHTQNQSMQCFRRLNHSKIEMERRQEILPERSYSSLELRGEERLPGRLEVLRRREAR